jgi:hypothetical protein
VKETDWRIDSSPASDLAFRELAAAPRFGGTVDELLSEPELPVIDAGTRVAPRRFQAVTFPVRLSRPSTDAVQVGFIVGNADGRKVRHKRGRIRIAPGHRHARLRVWVRDGGSSHARTDGLVVHLFSPDGAKLARHVARGTLHLR